jgi:hypothetical protein
MPFDAPIFEAEVALKLIPTERLPLVAQDALEAGFDGLHLLRMAILEPIARWEIDQQLPDMLAELGCRPISPKEAALRLARNRAERIRETGEDLLPSIPYFNKLMLAADYPEELIELGYLDDDDIFFDDSEHKQKHAREALEDLLSPELRQKRLAERKVAWEQEQTKIKSEWPYVLNSPTGRALLKERYKEKLVEMRPFLWIDLVAWAFVGFALRSWRIALIGYVAMLPLLAVLPICGEYRRMRRERRDTLLRRGVPDDQI